MAYDTFEDGTINRWTQVDVTGGSFAASTDADKFGVYGGRFTTDGAGDHEAISYKNSEANETSGNYYMWWRSSDKDVIINWWSRNAGDSASCWTFQVVDLGPGVRFNYKDGDGWHAFTEIPANNTWYRFRVEWDGAGDNQTVYLYDTAGTLLETSTPTTAQTDGTLGDIRMAVSDDTGAVVTVDVDNVAYTDSAEPGPPAGGAAYLNMKGYW